MNSSTGIGPPSAGRSMPTSCQVVRKGEERVAEQEIEPEPRRLQHRDCSPERLPRQAQVGAAREPKPQRRQRREKQCQTPCVAQGGGIRGFDLQHARMQNCPQGERGRDHQQSCHDRRPLGKPLGEGLFRQGRPLTWRSCAPSMEGDRSISFPEGPFQWPARSPRRNRRSSPASTSSSTSPPAPPLTAVRATPSRRSGRCRSRSTWPAASRKLVQRKLGLWQDIVRDLRVEAPVLPKGSGGDRERPRLSKAAQDRDHG